MAIIAKSYRFDQPVVGYRVLLAESDGYTVMIGLHAFTTSIYLLYPDGIYELSPEFFTAIKIWLDNFMESVSLEDYVNSVQISEPRTYKVHTDNDI